MIKMNRITEQNNNIKFRTIFDEKAPIELINENNTELVVNDLGRKKKKFEPEMPTINEEDDKSDDAGLGELAEQSI